MEKKPAHPNRPVNLFGSANYLAYTQENNTGSTCGRVMVLTDGLTVPQVPFRQLQLASIVLLVQEMAV